MANGPADTDLHASLPHAASSSAAPAPERLAASYRSPAAYTEEESLAILDAERAGSPHPFPDREARRSGASALPARIAEPATAEVLHFSFWAEERRAMPSDFIACALFAGIQEKDVAYLNDVEIANANGLRIVFKGNQLTQVHADVWQGIMHLARRQNEGATVRFKARPFLRMIGRQTGKKQRDDLKHWFTDLTATSVEIVDSKNKRRFWGSLLPNGASQDEHDETMFVVEVSRPLAQLFAENLGMVDWHVRQRLFKKPLALWWQFYSSKFRKPVAVAELHRLSGSMAKLKEFRRKLALAIQAAEKAAFPPTSTRRATPSCSALRPNGFPLARPRHPRRPCNTRCRLARRTSRTRR